MGSVLLAAWISQQETTYMAAAPMGTALPEGAEEQVGAASKGYQQVTAWQVRTQQEVHPLGSCCKKPTTACYHP